MNKYITLDGKQYTTPHQEWNPEVMKPSTLRILLSGNIDASYGEGILKKWLGFIRAYVTPLSGYGSPSDLRTSLQKRQGLSFTDHYGSTFTVHVNGYRERSFTAMWDDGDNFIDFQVELKGK